MVVKERVEDLEATLALLEALIGLTVEEREAFQGRLARRRRPWSPLPCVCAWTLRPWPGGCESPSPPGGWKSKQDCCVITLMGELFAHAVGSVRRLSEADLQRVDPIAYSASHFIGRLGVEAHYERALHGAVGHERVETDARGRITRILDRTPPGPGTI